MIAENFSLQAYCQRIQFQGTPSADIASLSTLMQQQLQQVPFENLDVQAGKVVSLQAEDIVSKIIQRQRGGYCYEVNGLFAMLLEALGVTYYFVAARPMFYPQERPRTHMALIVTLAGQQWLFDLGFGSYGIREPMRLDQLDSSISQSNDRFMLSKLGEEYILKAWVDGEWVTQYGFYLQPQRWIDFLPANWMNSTHPDVIFTQKLLVVRFTATGRDILFGNTFKQINNQQVSQRELNEAEQGQILQSFGLPTVDQCA